MRLDRRTVGILLVGTLAALALALAAATLANPVESGGGDSFGIEGNISGLFGNNESTAPPQTPIPPFVGTIVRIGLLVFFTVGVAAGIIFLERPDVIRIIVMSVIAVLLFWLLLELVSLLSGSGEFGVGGSGGLLSGGASGMPGNAGGESVSLLLLSGVGVVALFAMIVLLALPTDESDREPESAVEEPTGGTLAPVGRAAGRAADEIADSDTAVDNAVYRAWVEMTEALDVPNRDSTTPGEFAEAAIAAGMDPADVRELTRLFEDVRYGDEPVSAERAAQAKAALRRIESAYAGDSP